MVSDRVHDLERKMKSNRVTQTELAEVARKNRPEVNLILHGRINATEDEMDSLHEAFAEIARDRIRRLQESLGQG